MAGKKKTLAYYLDLDYDINIVKIEDDGEFIYKAYTTELNPDEFYGIGETKKDAIESFEHVRSTLLPYYIDNNLDIPEPKQN